jgi:hypothetical protein
MTRKQDDFSRKQEEISRLQNETHREVLNINDNMSEMKDTVGNMQSSLNFHEQMSMHNAKGVRLVSRAVSSLIPQEVELVREMRQYEKDGYELAAQQNFRTTFPYSTQNLGSADNHYNGQMNHPPFDPFSKGEKTLHFSTQEPRSQHLQQQQQHVSPEREIEIPITRQSSDNHLTTNPSYFHNIRNDVKFANSFSDGVPIYSLERGIERPEKDEAFDDIRDMAFTGVSKATISTSH